MEFVDLGVTSKYCCNERAKRRYCEFRTQIMLCLIRTEKCSVCDDQC